MPWLDEKCLSERWCVAGGGGLEGHSASGATLRRAARDEGVCVADAIDGKQLEHVHIAGAEDTGISAGGRPSRPGTWDGDWPEGGQARSLGYRWDRVEQCNCQVDSAPGVMVGTLDGRPVRRSPQSLAHDALAMASASRAHPPPSLDPTPPSHPRSPANEAGLRYLTSLLANTSQVLLPPSSILPAPP